MHQRRRANDRAAVDVTDRLEAEAHAEHRHAALGERGHDGADDAGILGPARARRQQHGVGLESERLVDGELIVAHDDRVGTEFAEVLHEVVDEAVVAVDHQNPLVLSRHQTAAALPVVSNVFCGLCSHAVAPPKRKTSGRVTPKGTRPGQATTTHEPITHIVGRSLGIVAVHAADAEGFLREPAVGADPDARAAGDRGAGDPVAIRHLGHAPTRRCWSASASCWRACGSPPSGVDATHTLVVSAHTYPQAVEISRRAARRCPCLRGSAAAAADPRPEPA